MPEEVTLNVKLNVDKSDLERQIKSSIGGGGKGGLLSGLTGGAGTKGGGLLGGMLGKAGFLAIALNQTVELLGKIKNVLLESSPSFKATASIFKQAMSLFFKPFGDFLGNLLRPVAIRLLKWMISWQSISKEIGAEVKRKLITSPAESLASGLTGTLEREGKEPVKIEGLLDLTTALTGMSIKFIHDLTTEGFVEAITNAGSYLKEILSSSWENSSLYKFYRWITGKEDAEAPELSLSTLLSNALLSIPSAFSGGLWGLLNPYGDFIAQNGQISQFSPDDTVIGVKDTSAIGGNNITVQVDSLLTGDIVEQITDRIRREVMLT